VIDTALLVNAGTVRLEEGSDVNGTVRANGGEILATGNATLDGTVELPPGNRSLRANTGATLAVNGTVTGPGTLLKDGGAGTLELAAANTHAGGTRVANGTLALRGDGNPGQGDLIMAGGTLATAGSAPVAFDTPIGFTNNTTVNAAAPLATGGPLAMPGPRALTKTGTNVWSIGGTLFGAHADYRFLLRDGIVRFAPGSRFTMDTPNLAARNQFDASSIRRQRPGVDHRARRRSDSRRTGRSVWLNDVRIFPHGHERRTTGADRHQSAGLRRCLKYGDFRGLQRRRIRDRPR
jgi:autotransporter-associated beta strand protein